MSEVLTLLAQRLPELTAMAVLLAFSAFFSASETALFSLSREDLRGMKSSATRTHRYILALVEDPQKLLATVLFGNMVVNVTFYSLSFMVAWKLSKGDHHTMAAVTGVAALLVLILLGEVSPKGIAIGHPLGIAHLVAPPLYVLHRLAGPATRILTGISSAFTGFLQRRVRTRPYVTSDELRMLVGLAQKQGALGHSTGGMIAQVVKLADIRVKEVMTPRVDMALFHLPGSAAEFHELFRKTREDLIPVCEESPDNIIGFLRARDVFTAPEGADLRALMQPVRFVPETQPLESLLRQFRQTGEAAVVVVDEFGGTSGLVTLEHILEEVVGEMRQEHEPREVPVRQLDQDEYLVTGNLSAREWRPLLGTAFDTPGVDTVGGFVTSLLGHIPKQGESVEWNGLRFVVEKMHGRRVEQVRVLKARKELP